MLGSAQLESCSRLNCIQQFFLQRRLVAELGQLEKVHAGTGRRETIRLGAAVVDAEGRVELLDAWNDKSADNSYCSLGPTTNKCRKGGFLVLVALLLRVVFAYQLFVDGSLILQLSSKVNNFRFPYLSSISRLYCYFIWIYRLYGQISNKIWKYFLLILRLDFSL